MYSEARSEYGLEDVDDIERLSQLRPDENDLDGAGSGDGGQEELQALQRSFASR